MSARRLAPISAVAFVPLAAFLVAAATAFAPLAAEETTPAAPPPTTSATEPAALPPATPPPATAPTPASETSTAPSTTPTTAPLVPTTRPRIVAETTSYDAGKVRKGKRLEIEFALVNRGDGPLAIKDAQPSCGCTVASFDKTIAPGATGKVRARLDTSNFVGPIAKQVTVLSNDPDTPRLVLTIKAEIMAFVRVQPSYVRFLHVRSQESTPQAVTLWSTDERRLELSVAETPAPWVTATVRRATAEERLPDVAAEQWRLEVALAPEAPLGPLGDAIKVSTGHPDEPEIEVPLSGNVRAVLHAQPSTADFGNVVTPVKSPRKIAIKIHNFGKEPVEIRSVVSDLPLVSATATTESPGLFLITLVLSPEAPKGSFEGTVKVETSSALIPMIEIPVRGKVK